MAISWRRCPTAAGTPNVRREVLAHRVAVPAGHARRAVDTAGLQVDRSWQCQPDGAQISRRGVDEPVQRVGETVERSDRTHGDVERDRRHGLASRRRCARCRSWRGGCPIRRPARIRPRGRCAVSCGGARRRSTARPRRRPARARSVARRPSTRELAAAPSWWASSVRLVACPLATSSSTRPVNVSDKVSPPGLRSRFISELYKVFPTARPITDVISTAVLQKAARSKVTYFLRALVSFFGRCPVI